MNDSRTQALDTLRAEHRNLAAVIHALKELAGGLSAGQQAPDFRLLWSIVHYIDAFPDRQHHPKEDAWLFRLLRERTPLADALIDELQRQHAHEPVSLGEIRRHLGNLQAGVAGAGAALQRTVHAYADFTWRHLRTEEQELLPLAETHLLPADWDAIAQAFARDRDPLAGAREADELLARLRDIVARLPAPLGLG